MAGTVAYLDGANGTGTPLWVSAKNPLPVTGGTGVPYSASPKGYQQLTLTGSAQALTVPAGATFALISLTGPNALWRDDGSNPTTTVGMPMYAGSAPQQFAGDLAALKFIAASGSPVLNISYYA